MLWRIPADLHERRIGDMALTQAFFGCPGPATSVSATRVFPARLSRWRGTSGVAEIAENKFYVATGSSGTARVGSCRRHSGAIAKRQGVQDHLCSKTHKNQSQPHPEEPRAARRLEGWATARLVPTLRDAALRAAPQGEAVGNSILRNSALIPALERRFDRAEAREFAARLRARRKIAQPRPRAGGDRLAFGETAATTHRVIDHPGERTHRIDGAQPAALVDDDVAVDDQPHLQVRPIQPRPVLHAIAHDQRVV